MVSAPVHRSGVSEEGREGGGDCSPQVGKLEDVKQAWMDRGAADAGMWRTYISNHGGCGNLGE